MTHRLLHRTVHASFVVCLTAGATYAPVAFAEKADRDKPINYQADTGDVNVQTKVGTLTGSVILTQGTLTIHADKIVFHQNPDNSVSATAWGNPITFREKRDNVDEYYEGVAQRAEYDGQKRFLELFDRALLRKGADEIRSNYISYNAETEFFKAGRQSVAPVTPAPGLDPKSTLSVTALNKRYKSRTVVHDVSLAVGSGEVVGLLGPNGAGKTTCFYMIVGLVATDGGAIELDGDDLTRMPIHVRARLGLSYLPQEASIFRKLTVAQNVQAILELQGIDGDEIANRLDALLEDLSISHLRDAPALSLSGGERRRVEIARALATRPRFILLDEPFAGIDPIAVLDIQKIIGFLKERGIGVMITDHNVRETLGICDRAYIISDGRVLASGTPDEIVYNESVRKVYLGEHFRL